MIIAGVGFSSQCEPQELVALVRSAEASTAMRAESLATPTWKLTSPCLRAAAEILALPVTPIGESDLVAVAPRCVTSSAASQARAGTPSVAEAAALAAGGASARLVLPRIASPHATCALAHGEPS